MKKRFLTCAAAAAMCLALCSCDFIDRIFGNDQTSAQPEETAAAVSEAPEETTAAEESTQPEESTIPASEEITDEASGGNPDHEVYIDITVSEDKYFYDNHEISFDELIELFDGLEENSVVRLTDENASKKAYEAVTKALDERSIPYDENIPE